ncbi:MAG: hypothetical protein ACRD0W_21880 [Acidimicrobiales bacterium]
MSSTVFYADAASELATLTNTFSVSGTPTDPTDVALVVTTPSGVATTYLFSLAQITKTGTGVYTKSIVCSEAGEWQAVWKGTGPATDTQVVTWHVWPTDLGHLYPTVAALKSRLGITDTSDDLELHGACFSASRDVEQHCQRVFYRSAAATVRTFAPTDPYSVKLPEFNDVVSVSALATDSTGDGVYETAWTAIDYQLLPFNPAGPETKPYTEIKAVAGLRFPTLPSFTGRDDRVQISGVFGWPTVPLAVREAALIMAEETFKLKDAPFGVAGFGDFGAVRVRNNPMAAAKLAPYRRHIVLVG